jgi:hypothetical protein
MHFSSCIAATITTSSVADGVITQLEGVEQKQEGLNKSLKVGARAAMRGKCFDRFQRNSR